MFAKSNRKLKLTGMDGERVEHLTDLEVAEHFRAYFNGVVSDDVATVEQAYRAALELSRDGRPLAAQLEVHGAAVLGHAGTTLGYHEPVRQALIADAVRWGLATYACSGLNAEAEMIRRAALLTGMDMHTASRSMLPTDEAMTLLEIANSGVDLGQLQLRMLKAADRLQPLHGRWGRLLRKLNRQYHK
jgi:hypothetical protein